MENDPFIGSQLGSYHVQGTLGEGGMAHVYKAYHSRLRREVAIKVILSEIADREGFQARFEREAQVVASLEHPNIVSVYDFGEDSTRNVTYLVMQYVGGGTLRDQLRGGRPIEPQRAIRYGIQMARALHHAHQRGIVHRDVKPPNMLVSSTDSSHLLLSDFGIAKLYASNEDAAFGQMPTLAGGRSSELTSVNQVIGTADYMAPEQANGQPVDARTDVYALGIVLYHMLAGEVPFHSTTLRGLLFQQVYTPAPSVRTKNLQVPEPLAQVILKAMAKAPSDRFQTAEEMAKALEYANTALDNAAASLRGGEFPTALSTVPRPSNYPSGPMTPPFSGTINGSSTSTAPSFASGPRSQQNQPITQAGSWAQSQPNFSHATSIPGGMQGVNMGVTAPPAYTGAGGTAQGQLPARQRKRFPLSYALIALVIVASVIVFGSHFLNQGSTGSGTNTGTPGATPGPAQAFTETFQDQSRNWSIGAQSNGVVAQVASHSYTVSVTPSGTTFAVPTSVGALPANFTLDATMTQTQGSSDSYYGLAFRYTDVSDTSVTCYAFLIDKAGDYTILEYSPDNGGSSQELWRGHYTVARIAQTLQVKAASNDYTFAINRQNVYAGASNYTLHTTAIQNGDLALAFSGPHATFVATRVQLTLP